METEPPLVGRSRPLLFGMHVHQAGIEVQRQQFRGQSRRPHPRPRRRPRRLQLSEQGLINRVQHPPRRRLGSHLAEQVRLVAQHLQIRNALTAVGQHNRQIHQHIAGIVTATSGHHRRQSGVEITTHACSFGHIRQKPGTGMAHHPTPIRGHLHPRPPTTTIHFQGDPSW